MSASPIRIGVIGGSGLYHMAGLTHVQELSIDTPFGKPSDVIISGEINQIPVAFLPRHGRGHVLSPSEVPYHANIYALKKLGVEKIISVSACGSLREDIAPGHIVVPNQLFDFTKKRRSSFFEEGWVAHISAADPFCQTLSQQLAEAVEGAGATTHRGGTFITIEGPRFSTKAESQLFRSWGMDIIGMTCCPEAFLAREAGMCYAVMGHVTDYDVWHESASPVTVEMVIAQLNSNIGVAQEAVKNIINRLKTADRPCECKDALQTALVTDPTRIPAALKEKLSLITDK